MKMVIGKIRESLDKLFLLALFAAGLGIAQYLVVIRSRIELSPPVVLPDEGFSIRLPVSEGWKSQTEWTVQEGGSLILAQFDAPSHQAKLLCDFRPYSKEEGTIQDHLTQRAALRRAKIMQVGERQLHNIQMNWILAIREQDQSFLFFGAGMAGDQVVELEVICQTDPDLARRIFMTVADGLRFKPKPPSLEAPNVTDGFDDTSDLLQRSLANAQGG